MKPVLVTGATGYIGGRLVPRLLADGRAVRCLARDPARLESRPWRDRVEVVRGDVLRAESLEPALAGVDSAYYLVHSMGGGARFEQTDVRAARAFARAARTAGVRRIVYLGGLGDPAAGLSPHLRSRQDTGAALGEAGVPVCELRAAVVVGAGSVSFEMVRYLAERLPFMICPRWVFVRAQPIAIDDVLSYLLAALDAPAAGGRVVEIGGADVLTYGEMMLAYAEVRGLRRRLIAVPVLTPRLSSYWVDLVTPIPSTVSRPLIEGLRSEVVVRSPLARELFPDVAPIGYREAVRRALRDLDDGTAVSRLTDAARVPEERPSGSREGMVVERRSAFVSAPPGRVFATLEGLGGARGWPYLDAAWRLRGIADRLVGGVGLRRGRRDPDHLTAGDALDFWRVERLERDRLLRLRAEMRLPGAAWLQFEVHPKGAGSELTQTAFFAPHGLAGLAYWGALYPIHRLIFAGTVAALARSAGATVVVDPV